MSIDFSGRDALFEGRATGCDQLSILVNRLAAGRGVEAKRIIIFVNALVKNVPYMVPIPVVKGDVGPDVAWAQIAQLLREIACVAVIRP